MQVSLCPIWQCLEWLAIGPLYTWGLIGWQHCSHSTQQHSTYSYMENVPNFTWMLFYQPQKMHNLQQILIHNKKHNENLHYFPSIGTKMQVYTTLHDFQSHLTSLHQLLCNLHCCIHKFMPVYIT